MPRRFLIFCLFFCLAASVASAQTDETPPVATYVDVNGNILTIVYSESLDEAAVPSPGSFEVRHAVEGYAVEEGRTRIYGVNGVSVSGSMVTLTLRDVVPSGEIQVSYSGGGQGAIQDLAGNEAASFALTITYTDSVAVPSPPSTDPAPLPGSGGDYIDDMVEACRTFINAAEGRDR